MLRAVPRLRPLLLRRSRGFVPDSLPLPGDGRPLLACGAELKSTFCVAKGGRAWVGHHIGDLKHYEVLQAYEAGVEHFERLFAVTPEVVVHDEHPDYLSTALRAGAGRRRDGRRPAPPRAPRRLPGRARRERPRGRRDLRRHGLRPRRDGLGRRDAGRRPARLRARRAPVAGAAAGRRPRGRASRGGWRSRGCSRRAGTARCPGPDRAARRAGRRARPDRRVVAADDEHGAAVRRRRRAVRAARRGHLRGAGGGRARGARRPGEAGAYDMPGLDARPTILAVADDVARGTDPAVISARFHNAVARATADALHGGARRPLGRRLPEPPRSSPRPASRSRLPATACSSRSACRPTTAASPTAKPPSPPRADQRGLQSGALSHGSVWVSGRFPVPSARMT